MYCENCGCNIPVDSHFCPYCGKKTNPAVIYVEEEKKSMPLEMAKNLAASGERSLNKLTQNFGSQLGQVQENTNTDQTAVIIRVVIAALLIIVSFRPWIGFGGSYGTSYPLIKLFTVLDRGFGGLAYALFAYSDESGALIVKIIMLMLSGLGLIMVLANIISIFAHLTNSPSKEKAHKWALSASSSASSACVTIIFALKIILMLQDYDFSGVINFKAAPFLTWGLILLEGLLINMLSKNKPAQ